MDAMPLVDELLDKYLKDSSCAITGHETVLQRRGDGCFHWCRSSYDHILPLKDSSKSDVESWSIDNLQVINGVVNNVKGHFSDDEVKQWYHQYKMAMLQEESRNKAAVGEEKAENDSDDDYYSTTQ